jgi:hypothetical protein
MTKRFLFLLLAGLLSTNLAAQNKKERILHYDTATFKGKVVLPDGTVLTGRIKFNQKEGHLSFRDEFESTSFQPEDIGYFEFEDNSLHRLRRYYSIEYTDPETSMADVHFFEVLKELKDFALVAKMDRVKNTTGRLSSGNSNSFGGPSTTMAQTETVYFMSQTGELFPYLKIVEKETEGMVDLHYIKNSFIDQDLFEKFTSVHYPELVQFASDNNLQFKRKNDLVRILDQYELLSSD